MPDYSSKFQTAIQFPASGMPIDTVKIMFHVDPSRLLLENWVHTIKESKKSGKVYFQESYHTSFFTSNRTRVSLSFCPRDAYGNGKNLLFIEFSLPKVLYGCNHAVIENWESSLNNVNAKLANNQELAGLDIRDGILYRLDICMNFQVGKIVKDYIQALLKASYPRRQTMPYQDTGVMFKTKRPGISITFYDKKAECGHGKAKGILRAEISIRKKGKIAGKLDKKSIKLGELSSGVLLQILCSDIKILHLDKPIVCDRKEVERRLSNVYSPRKVRTLLGYWLESQTKTRSQIIDGGTSRRCICYYEKLLREANVSSRSFGGKMNLPPLILE